jgi:hypothetical protein
MTESTGGIDAAKFPADGPPPPATVFAIVILVCVGGIKAALDALVTGTQRDLGPIHVSTYGFAVYYLLVASLGFALRQRKGWARTALVVGAVLGIGIAVLAFINHDLHQAIAQATGPITYLILLSTPTARSWFQRQTPPARALQG